MPLVPRNDPYGGFNFQITLTNVSTDGTAVTGSFTEVSGLDAEIAPIEYRNGSEDITMRKMPGLKKFTNIVLKRGVIGDVTFWNWILQGLNGAINRVDGNIILLNEQKTPVMQWNITRAWPCKYTGPGLNAKNSEIAIESLEICHEGLSIDGQNG
jgi:phage tail-like protein